MKTYASQETSNALRVFLLRHLLIDLALDNDSSR